MTTTFKGRLVWGDPSKIKGNTGIGDWITVFGCIMMILCGSNLKSPPLLKSSPNPVMGYLSLKLGIQDHPW